MNDLVAFYADRPGAGKSTCAQYLKEFGYVTVSFAQPIKMMAHSFLEELGIEIPEDKEETIPELGCSLRHIYRSLGSQWGREMINDRCWVMIAGRVIRRLRERGHKVCVDDLRFDLEYKLLKDLGFVFYQVINDRVPRHEIKHDSEEDWVNFVPDHTIYNQNGYQELHSELLLTVLRANTGLGPLETPKTKG